MYDSDSTAVPSPSHARSESYGANPTDHDDDENDRQPSTSCCLGSPHHANPTIGGSTSFPPIHKDSQADVPVRSVFKDVASDSRKYGATPSLTALKPEEKVGLVETAEVDDDEDDDEEEEDENEDEDEYEERGTGT